MVDWLFCDFSKIRIFAKKENRRSKVRRIISFWMQIAYFRKNYIRCDVI